MRSRPYLLSLAGLFLLSVSPLQAQIVTNGGFETGDFTGWTLTGDPAINFVDTGFANTGNYAAWFGEEGGLGTLSQALVTTPGNDYSLTFYFAGDGDSPSAFQALIDSTVLLDLVDPPFDLDYLPYTYTFTAASASTLLSFKFQDDDFFINLDDVSVTALSAPVPEPGSIALLAASALTGAGFLACRKQVRSAA